VALRRRRQSAVEDAWHADPGFASVALEEPPADEPGLWAAAAEPIDVTDSTVDMPVLAALPRRRAARAGHALLTLGLVLGCAGAAVAASGVLKAKHEDSPPPIATGSSSAVAPARHHDKPAQHKRVVHRHHRHHARRRRVAVAPPRRIVAAAPLRSAPAPVRPVARQPVSRPAPKPATSTPTAAPQPAPSAPSGEPGRQPQPQP
jgi:hypothetical protein